MQRYIKCKIIYVLAKMFSQLQDLLKNGFDDLIDDESEDEDSVTSLGDSYHPRRESVNNKYAYTRKPDGFQESNGIFIKT